jgi:hypothetical protein
VRARIWKKDGVWHWRVTKPGGLTITGRQPALTLAYGAALKVMGQEAA